MRVCGRMRVWVQRYLDSLGVWYGVVWCVCVVCVGGVKYCSTLSFAVFCGVGW